MINLFPTQEDYYIGVTNQASVRLGIPTRPANFASTTSQFFHPLVIHLKRLGLFIDLQQSRYISSW